jgi:hypothetical protein
MGGLLSRAKGDERMGGTSGWARTTGLDLRRVALLPLSYGRVGKLVEIGADDSSALVVVAIHTVESNRCAGSNA